MKLISYFSKILLLLCLTNLALPLSADTTIPAETATSRAQQQTAAVNINEANAELLAKTLKGIGLKKAKAIVEYRESYGPFHNIQELASVKGIGKATVKKNEKLITLE